MTCYFRHLKEVFKKAGIEVTRDNKRDIDRVIHDIVGIEYKSCSETWKVAKERVAEDEERFINELRSGLISHNIN